MERLVINKGISGVSPGRQGGITMIELMIVVVIVAILGSIAVPSYRDYVVRSNRMEAINELLDEAACQERIYIKRNRYDETRCSGRNFNSENGLYAIRVRETDAGQGFRITAIPQDGQARDDAACANLRILHTGERLLTSSTNNTTIDDCWRGKKVSS